MADPPVAEDTDLPSRTGLSPGARLIVIAGVTAAVSIAVFTFLGSLRGHERYPFERYSAIACCEEIGSAQGMYHRYDWNKDGVLEYAQSFPTLYSQVDAKGEKVKLISEALSLATSPAKALHGYYFGDMASHETEGPYANENGNQPDGFGICAVPADYAGYTKSTLIMDKTGIVYMKDNGGRPVTVFPADPPKEGWEVAE